MAMGLCGWEVTYNTSEQSTTDGDWLRFCFHRPRSKVPLAIFHLSGEFDLPAGGGHGKVGLGYVSTDLDYVVSMRSFCECPAYRLQALNFPSSHKVGHLEPRRCEVSAVKAGSPNSEQA